MHFIEVLQIIRKLTSEGILSVDMAISKDIINDNGTLALNVSDLVQHSKKKQPNYYKYIYK